MMTLPMSPICLRILQWLSLPSGMETIQNFTVWPVSADITKLLAVSILSIFLFQNLGCPISYSLNTMISKKPKMAYSRDAFTRD